ncbi:membrane transporter [Coprinopsis sp. MPI-PUGE-AT-0042]|nr:membrane transporter [Coprinopsis sp. MPI-PUGE-AT-0042]
MADVSPPSKVVHDSPYEQKVHVLNEAIQGIGFGKYHRRLFIVSGFGWFVDSALPLLTGLILPSIVAEFSVNGAYLVLAANSGLLSGAFFWGFVCDVYGRRWPFNLTLLVAGIFGIASGGAMNFQTVAVLMAFMGFGVGGNIPIDSAMFLEFMPSKSHHLLTVLATFWVLGQIFVNLVSWPLIAHFSCQPSSDGLIPCQKADNMGWRYLNFTLGAFTLIMASLRFFVVPLFESPRYLLGRGRDAEAVEVVNEIAKINGVAPPISLQDLQASDNDQHPSLGVTGTASYLAECVASLFFPTRMAISTVLLILLWSTIGLATTLYNSFLPYLLASKGAVFGDASLSIAYRNQLIITCSGLLSPYIASRAVEARLLGRRGTLAMFCALTGILLLGSTTSRNSNALLGWNCGYSFASNAMYGVLYAFTSEVFPTKARGTGNSVVSSFNRAFGVVAPLIALNVDVTTSVPAYIGGALTIVAGALALLVPYEPRGKDAI